MRELQQPNQSRQTGQRSHGSVNTVLWCMCDGKPGHEHQSRGLIDAIAARRPTDVHFLRARSIWQDGRDWLRGRYAPGDNLPSPRLIIAAGHKTHAAAITARRARGGRLVVLMRPTLPLKWFDVCVIPEHDFDRDSHLSADPRIVMTRGVLNGVRPADDGDPRRGLILIGGPSKHHGWDEESLIGQIHAVVSTDQAINWTLTTSRRTPRTFTERATKTPIGNLTVIPHDDTPAGWLAGQLASVRTVFVTEDSVSMVYEALSAGPDVGLLAVPRKRTSRVVRGIDRLIEERAVIPFAKWRENGFSIREPLVLREAERCAQIVCARLLDAA